MRFLDQAIEAAMLSAWSQAAAQGLGQREQIAAIDQIRGRFVANAYQRKRWQQMRRRFLIEKQLSMTPGARLRMRSGHGQLLLL